MDLIKIFQVLALLTLANGAPVIAKRILGTYFLHPIDFGFKWFDGRRVLGRSKTFRGILASIVACSAGGIVLGVNLATSTTVALGAMFGDALASFLKRRLGIEPSGRAFGLDYIPEALVPTLTLTYILNLTAADVVIIVVVFCLGAAGLSPLLYRLGIRDRPY